MASGAAARAAQALLGEHDLGTWLHRNGVPTDGTAVLTRDLTDFDFKSLTALRLLDLALNHSPTHTSTGCGLSPQFPGGHVLFFLALRIGALWLTASPTRSP